MKKTVSFITLFAIILLSFTACTPTSTGGGTATVVIGTDTPTEYTLVFQDGDITNGLLSAFDMLELEYDISGGFLNGVGDLNPQPPTYIWIYTSVSADADVSSYATTLVYKGATLTSTGKGAEEMTIEDGAIIYVGTITYG